MKHLYSLLFFLVWGMLFSGKLCAQNAEWQYIKDGNKFFRLKQFNAAEASYKKALKVNSANARAYYDLGNVYMAQGRDSLAMAQYDETLRLERNPMSRSMTYHNRGVIAQSRAAAAKTEGVKQNLLREAIKEYKGALRENPQAQNSRYNLALCQKQLRESEQDPQNQPPPPSKQQDPNPQPQNNPLINYARQAERKAREKINQNKHQKSLDKNW